MDKRLMTVVIFAIMAATLVSVIYLVVTVRGPAVPVLHAPTTPADVTNQLTPVKRTSVGGDLGDPAEASGITPDVESETLDESAPDDRYVARMNGPWEDRHA